MATIKAVIKEREKNKQGLCNIKFRITHNNRKRYIATQYYVPAKMFSLKDGRVRNSHQNAAFINIELQKTQLEYEKKLIQLGESIVNVDVDKLIELIRYEKTVIDFFFVMNLVIENFKKTNQNKTAEIYSVTLKELHEFYKFSQLDFKLIDFKFLTDFDIWLRQKGRKANTIAIHMRNIRAIFNKAINFNYVKFDVYPFRTFKVKFEKTVHRNLTIDQIKKIRDAKVTGRTEFARDFFMLSFYLIGINIVDLYNLKEIVNGRIPYKRAKTGKDYSVKVEPEAILIIEKYKGTNNLLIFKEWYTTENTMKNVINSRLKKLCLELEIDENISTYFARHSWASIAHQIGIPKSDIALALGHGAFTVTDIYIDTDLNIIDRANRKVLDALL